MTEASKKADAVVQVLAEVGLTFHRMRTVGRPRGAVTEWGGGLFAMLRTLKLGGPMTVPQIARTRPVARQRIQRLADDAAKEGLVAFIDNPAHKRSRLVELTPAGQVWYEERLQLISTMAVDWSKEVDAADLKVTLETLRALGAGLLETINEDDLPPLDEG
ncbi:MAG: MarR family winged helix-turn-helix transcriptional regulator [Alphaproteobacteria bacterium]